MRREVERTANLVGRLSDIAKSSPSAFVVAMREAVPVGMTAEALLVLVCSRLTFSEHVAVAGAYLDLLKEGDQ